MKALRHFYYDLGDKIWGEYGFTDAFNETQNWYAKSYLAIDQGPIIVMIENYRSGLMWKLFMSCPEVRRDLKSWILKPGVELDHLIYIVTAEMSTELRCHTSLTCIGNCSTRLFVPRNDKVLYDIIIMRNIIFYLVLLITAAQPSRSQSRKLIAILST